MISLDAALLCYQQQIPRLPSHRLSLSAAHRQTLAKDLHALNALPPVTQSAMDGYAVRYDDLANATVDKHIQLPLAFSVAAGDKPQALPSGYCARIMTGAALPAGADAVEIQENVQRLKQEVVFSKQPALSANIRQAGEEIAPGQRLLKSGARLNAQRLSIAASSGHGELDCIRPARCSVIITGNELVPPGQSLRSGQIHESNGTFLRAFLSEVAADCRGVHFCRDEPAALIQTIHMTLMDCDLLIITGGASVGDHDYSRQAAHDCGIREQFWKVAQKPGKPISFGLGPDGQAVFILPGNPASVHVCASVHLRHALAIMHGQAPPTCIPVRLAAGLRADPRRERLLRAALQYRSDGAWAEALPFQASHMLSNLSQAKALIRLPAGRDLARGTLVNAWLLPEL